jgi:outer membrane lipoprotein LolB
MEFIRVCAGSSFRLFFAQNFHSRTVPVPGLLALCACLLLLSACTTQTPLIEKTKEQNWENNKAELEKIHSWTLHGRIAVQVEKESGSASLQWQQDNEDYLIRIIGPFGKGTIELNGNKQGVSLRDANNQLQKARNMETLLGRYLGWHVPIDRLNYWIRGIPNPEQSIETMVLDEHARLSELSQAGWQVSYGAYMKQDARHLPRKLELRNQGLKVKLIVRKWQTRP